MKLEKLLFLVFAIALIPAAAEAASVFNLEISFGACAGGTQTTCSTDPSAGFFSSIACRVMKVFSSGIMPLYCNILYSPQITMAINAAMVLYVTLLGVMYVGGIVQAAKGDIMVRTIKMLAVYTFATNVDVYMSTVFNTAMSLPDELIQLAISTSTTAGAGSQTFFEYVDKAIAQMFSTVVESVPQGQANENHGGIDMRLMVIGLAIWKLMPGGEFVAFIFFTVVIGWIMTYLAVMVRIIVALLAIMFLLVIGPLVIPTILFKPTEFIGYEWVKMIVSFIIQMFITVMFLVMTESFYIQLADMLQAGYEKVKFEKELAPYLNQFASDVDSIETEGTYTSEGAKKYLEETLAGDISTWLPKFFFDLVVMMVVIISTFSFVKYIPTFAVNIAGSGTFPQLMGGEQLSRASNPVQLPFSKDANRAMKTGMFPDEASR